MKVTKSFYDEPDKFYEFPATRHNVSWFAHQSDEYNDRVALTIYMDKEPFSLGLHFTKKEIKQLILDIKDDENLNLEKLDEST